VEQIPSFSPSDFVAALNQTLEYSYQSVEIVGELANFKVSKGMWVYFDLKDDEASVKFFGNVYNLPGPVEEGMVVCVRGTPRLSPQYGFSVSFQSLIPVGEGSLKRAADLLQRKLSKEGLFDVARKRTLPYPPNCIGLVTSGQSAAYKDFTKVLAARFGGVEIIHADVGVQGEAAIDEVVNAVYALNQHAGIEAIVITRGGGSADDLAVFNTEQVTRAVAGSRVPTLVAIGHEVDVCLAERAADMRASTPSNAAELLVPDRQNVLQELFTAQAVMSRELKKRLEHANLQIAHDKSALEGAVHMIVERSETELRRQHELLKLLNPLGVLKRGYAVVRHGTGVVRSVSTITPGTELTVQVADGTFEVEVQ